MKPISIKPLTSSIVEAANNVSRDMGIVQPNGNAQEIGSGVLPIHAGAGKVSQADVETALKTAQAALEAAEAALEAAKNAQKDVTDLETDVNNKQDTLVSGENIKTVNGMTVLGAGNIVINPTIMDLQWTNNVATTRELVPAELRKKGVKIAYRDNNNVYHVEQYQVDAIDDASWENDVNWKGCRTPMTPLFENAGATFNDETGYYELDQGDRIALYNLTEQDMIDSYLCRVPFSLVNSDVSFLDSDTKPRIYFIIHVIASHTVTFTNLAWANTKLEVFKHVQNYPIKLNNAFYNCINLTKVYIKTAHSNGIEISASCFLFCPKLTDLRLIGIGTNLNIKNSPLITLDSFTNLVADAVNKEAITITAHPDVYAKLTDSTNTEWYAVNTAAQAKQIAFATTETVQVATLAEGVEPQVETVNGEFVCPIGYYITQAEDVTIENRLFLTRRMKLNGEDVSKWRIATTQEKQEQDNYFASQLPTE